MIDLAMDEWVEWGDFEGNTGRRRRQLQAEVTALRVTTVVRTTHFDHCSPFFRYAR